MGLLLGRLFLPPQAGGFEKGNEDTGEQTSWWKRVFGAGQRALPAFGRVAAVFMPVTLLVLVLMQTEFVKQILAQVDPILSYFGLPGPMLLVITTGVLSMVAAIGALGPMLQVGLVTPTQAVIALLFASALHYLYEFWSDDIPINISIFGPKLGGKVSLANLIVLESFTCLALGFVVLVH